MTYNGPAAIDRLAEFAAEAAWQDVPHCVQERALTNIADTWGVMYGGRDADATRVARTLVRRESGANWPPADDDFSPRLQAAWLAGIAGHVLDFDDTHWPTILHASTPIVASLIAIGEASEGLRFAEAYLVGFECAARVANSMPVGHYDRGWHITGTVGGIGAAVAAIRLLGGGASEMRLALSLAANQAAGHRQHFGSMAKSLNAGNAARAGLLAGLLVHQGFRPAPDGIEGIRGMWHVMSDGAKPEALSAGLGEDWEILRNGLKPYPCGVVSHPSIEAAERVRQACAERGVLPTSIYLTVHPLVAELTNKQIVEDLDVKFSVPALVAMGIVGVASDVKMYSASALAHRPDITALSERTVVVSDPDIQQDEAILHLTFDDGTSLTERVTAALGSPERPLPAGAVQAKFVSLTVDCLGIEAAGELFDRLITLDRAPDIRSVTCQLVSSLL